MSRLTGAEFERQAKALAAACAEASQVRAPATSEHASWARPVAEVPAPGPQYDERACQAWEWVKPPAGDERFAVGGGGCLRLQNVARHPRGDAAHNMQRNGSAGTVHDTAPSADKDGDLREADLLQDLELDDDPTSLAADPAREHLHIYEYHVVTSPAPFVCARVQTCSAAMGSGSARPRDLSSR